MSMHLKRRTLLAAAALFPVVQIAHAAPITLPSAVSLPDELKVALASGSPLLVMVSLEGCPFCRVARESYFGPMRERHGLPVVQVDMRSKQMLRNLQGVMQTHDEWIRAMGVKVAPTVLFFGRGGTEIVERMTGGYIPDFYGGYLDERLRQAKASLAS
jgi:thioredoxin-related protein